MCENLMSKAILLAKGEVCFEDDYENKASGNIKSENLYQEKWVFVKLNETSRVRLACRKKADLVICLSNDEKLLIRDKISGEIIADNIQIEETLVHAPEQLFLQLYGNCSVKCKFCPLAYVNEEEHFSLDSIYCDIESNRNKNVKSIGITTAIPMYLSPEDVGDELCFVIDKIRKKVNREIPIGVSTKIPSMTTLKKLKNAGSDEIRLNLEVWDDELGRKLMPRKNIREILESNEMAVEVFGRGRVSSNLILGIGETDDSVIEGINVLAKMGAIATLYPYDPIENGDTKFARPNAERLVKLAKIHKKILDDNHLDPCGLRTMCCACAASHLYPGRDF